MEKEKKQITIQIIETIVLLATFIAIAFSTYFTKKSIEQQQEFNLASIRPWIYITIDDYQNTEIINGLVRISEPRIGNSGESPAYKIEYFAFFSKENNFQEKNETSKQISGILEKNDHDRVEIKATFPDIDTLKSKKQIYEKSEKEMIYLHVYINYYDFENREYYFNTIFSTKITKDKRGKIHFHKYELKDLSSEKKYLWSI